MIERLTPGRGVARVVLFLAALFMAGATPAPARAQMLQGPWIDQSQRAIEQHRKTDVRVIVLDAAGDPVRAAKVRVEQQRHDFPLGFTLAERKWPEVDFGQPVWRCFNAVSLDRLTGWTKLEPAVAETGGDPLAALLDEADRRGMLVHWGGVLSADVALYPDTIAGLRGDALRGALEGWAQFVLSRYGQRVPAFDLYTDALDHAFVQDRLGVAALRGLFELGRATAPRAQVGIRFEDCLTGQRHEMLARTLTSLRHDFVPYEHVAVAQRFAGTVHQAQLARSLESMRGLGLTVKIVGLEVGGSSEAAAAINLETALRTLFADPVVEGIWLGPITANDVTTPGAALINPWGHPTRAGEVLESLFRQLWWTDLEATTDLVGNVHARIFAGTHRLTATLPDGASATMTVHVPRQDETRVIVVQPVMTAATQPAPR